MLKRIISFLLAVTFWLSCLPVVSVPATAEDTAFTEETPVEEIPEKEEPVETEPVVSEPAEQEPVPEPTEQTIVGIAVQTLPKKTKYIQNQEMLDLKGGSIAVNFSDGSQKILDMSVADKVNGFDNTVLGGQTIEVAYLGFYTYFDIVVIEETDPIRLQFNGWAVKNSYLKGEPLDLTGGELTII